MARRRGRTRRTPVVYVLLWLLVLLPSLAFMSFALFRMEKASAAVASALAQAPIATLPSAPAVAAVAAYVFDADTGAVYYSKDADEERPMASTTKIMTALLAVEHGNLDQVITVGADAQALVRPESSYMGLKAGEQLTLRDLLYGLLLPSGNDAAVAIADGIAGNQDAFVALMNARAEQLGLANTHYANPHGLDAPDHYTSAHDLAVLASVALQHPEIVQIASTLHYSIPKTAAHKAYELQTGNDLLAGARSPYPGAIGLKPGYTGGAGYTMAFAARRHGRLIIGAVLNDPSWQVRITDMRNLLDWGFEQDGIPAAQPVAPGAQPDPSDF